MKGMTYVSVIELVFIYFFIHPGMHVTVEVL